MEFYNGSISSFNAIATTNEPDLAKVNRQNSLPWQDASSWAQVSKRTKGIPSQRYTIRKYTIYCVKLGKCGNNVFLKKISILEINDLVVKKE